MALMTTTVRDMQTPTHFFKFTENGGHCIKMNKFEG